MYEGIDVDKTNESCRCIIYNFYYFLKINFRFQLKVCNIYHACNCIVYNICNYFC